MIKSISNPEIDDIQKEFDFELPGPYRKLLVMEGAGKLGDCVELFHPAEIATMFPQFFRSRPVKYFPFGRNVCTQQLWIIDAYSETCTNIPEVELGLDMPIARWHWQEYDEWFQSSLPDGMLYSDTVADKEG